MCDTLLNFLKLLCICLILFILVFIIQCHNKKDESSNNKSKCESFFNFIKEFCILISILSIASLLLSIFICIISNSLILIPEEKIGESIALIISSIIAVIGVFAGFFFNKKQTYKEIVTKERTLWLNKLKDKVSELLAILDVYDGLLNKSKYKVRAKDLFYNIITNLNVNYDKNSNKSTDEEDRRKEVELNKEAIIYLYLYAKNKGLEVELNFEDKEKIKKCEEELNKDSEKYGEGKSPKIEFQKAARKFALEKFTIIYKTVWKDIKGEAD